MATGSALLGDGVASGDGGEGSAVDLANLPRRPLGAEGGGGLSKYQQPAMRYSIRHALSS
jgi:hypothetical protein